MKRSRIVLLHQVFNKLLSETLKPLCVENLTPMMQNFPSQTAEELSGAVYKSIENNTQEEFKQIISEKNVEERLNTLDKLYAKQKSSYELNMNAFEFEHHDPERVKRAIIYGAKKQEIERLTRILSNLQQSNQNLQAKNEEILEELSKSREQIKETQERLQNFVSST